MARIRTLPTALALLVSAIASGQAQTQADRIWTGGPILTMNDAGMRAEALAEKDGRSSRSARRRGHGARGPGHPAIDLAGRAILPGFFDAHGHVFDAAACRRSRPTSCAPPDGEVQRHRGAAADPARLDRREPGRGREVRPDHRLRLRRLHPAEERGTHPRGPRRGLDRNPGPTSIHQSAHLGAANSKALEIVGYTAATRRIPPAA